MRVILDANVPRPLARLLKPHVVETTDQNGRSELSNGDLLEAAERSGFDVMVTADGNIRHQQNLSGRAIALVVLSTNSWPVIMNSPDVVVAAIEATRPGSYQEVVFRRPTLRRRRWSPR